MPVFPQSGGAQPQNCSSISNQGSLILVGNLDNCGDEPTIITLTPAAAAIGATSVTVTNNLAVGKKEYIRKGSILFFGATTPKKAVVTANTEIVGGASATPVPVEPLVAAITATDLAETWLLQKILVPQSIPINEEASTTDTTSLSSSLQGSETVTKLMLNPSIQIISRFDDRAYHQIIFEAAKVGGTVYTVFALSDRSHVFGRAVVSGNSREFAQSDINKPTFNLLMQSEWYSYGSFAYQTPANQVLINKARNLAGLDSLV